MSIPDYQTIMLPLLKFVADGKEHTLREIIEGLADIFNLNDEEKDNGVTTFDIYTSTGYVYIYLPAIDR